jgi:surfeit locus 1 family protein
VKTTGKIKRLLQAAVVLLLAAIFISLGFWQLDRARELKKIQSAPVVQDQRIYQLPDLTSPEGSLPVEAYGKSVEAHGHYIANFKAPNQKSADGTVADWDVALLQVDTESAILVVRGLWSDRFASPDIVMSTDVHITGTIYPSQFEDRAPNTPSQLSRLDSSLLTSIAEYQLYDGFIVETTEATRDGAVTRDRVTIALPKGGIPGYYWQHISYVVIWWFMAALVLWAPFYKRREVDDAEVSAS